MRKELEKKFIDARTKLMSEMLDNPDDCGIYKTTEFCEKLDKLVSDFIEHECVMFGAILVHYALNPRTEMGVPDMIYDSTRKMYLKYIEKTEI